MAKQVKPQVVTANDLFEGDVIYLTVGAAWSRDLKDAAVARTAAEAEALLARAQADQHLIVGAYLVEMELADDDIPQPAHFREAFRMRGPSNYFHGKQAEA